MWSPFLHIERDVCYNITVTYDSMQYGMEIIMRIAIPCNENGNVNEHFGHSKKFKIYELTDRGLTAAMVLDAVGSGHDAMADFLAKGNVKVVICDGIGEHAMEALQEKGILTVPGAKGDADQIVVQFVQGVLQSDEGATCGSHGGCSGGCGGCHGCH